ncbi:MAG: CocE/NonD family hydrolase, partial [Bacteroidales bacterium]
MVRLALFSLFLAFMASGYTQSPDKIKEGDAAQRYQELNIPMTDGVLLSTDVYLPKTRKRCPTVLVRTPYGKYAEKWMGKAFGFFNIAVVVQDCRGRYKSGGEFYPFINERVDGLETLKWIREQPWSDGTVAGWGSSYVGYTQWAVSDSLNFLTLVVTGANIYDFTYPDGLFSLQSAFTWGFQNDSAVSKSIP